MSGYPVIFDLVDRLCAVVGAGPVGCRKARGLLDSGARVRMISTLPPCDAELVSRLELRSKAFASEDLDGVFLVFAATGIDEVDRSVCAAARQRGCLVNSAASPKDGDFSLPAVLRRGDLLLTVATGGQSPTLARVLRDQMAKDYSPSWETVSEIFGRLRTRKLTGASEKFYSYEVLDKLLAAGLNQLVADGKTAEIDHLLTRVFGEELSLEDLGVDLRDVSS